MENSATPKRIEIWHKDYNLAKKDNIQEVPAGKAVFGIFGIIDDEPVNCRFVGETDNLRESVKHLFEYPEGEGMKKFMQGPWIQMLQYQLLDDFSPEYRGAITAQWKHQYKPDIDEDGEYPGYYQ
jgi:hypothetical protein